MTETSHTTPRLEPGRIERTHLLARLSEARHKSCVLIHGQAGSGKTSLALQWRAQALTWGHDAAWVTAQPGDDGQAVLTAFFASFDRIDPEIAREARLLANRGSGARADAIAIALLRAFLARKRPLQMVIDDWQNVEDEHAQRVLQTLLDFAPPAMRFVIVSRSLPPLSFARLRDQGLLEEIGPGELRFTLDEVQSFLQSRQLRTPSAAVARQLLEVTDGWAAGLQLLALQPRAPASPVQNAQDFTAYFNREVLCRVDKAEIDAMTRLAAARCFNQALAIAVAGEEVGAVLLERLQRENLFVLPFQESAGQGWYRFHPLFRELLLARFAALPQAERQQTHARLAQWLGARKHLRDAVHHAVEAGEPAQAADWVERWARELFLNGELQQLVRAVSELPRSIVNTRPPLLLWWAWTQLCYYQFAACHETLAALRSQLRPADHEGRAHYVLLAFSLALQQDDLRTAQALLPELMAIQQGDDAVLVGGKRNLLGWMYAHSAEYEKAREVLQGTPPLREDGAPLLDSAFGYLMTQALRGLSWLYAGDVRSAEPVLRDALAQSEKALGRYSEMACNAAAYLAAVLYEANELDELRQLLDGRLDTMERVVLPDALVTIALVCSRLSRNDGNPREALEGLARVEEIAQRRELDRLQAFVLSERVRCLMQMQDMAGAQNVLQQLWALAQRQGDSASPVSLRIGGVARYIQALVHDAQLEDRAALADLGERGRDDTPLLQRRDHCATRVLRALLLQRQGRNDEALEAMREALLQGHQLGLVRTVLDFGAPALALAQACVQAHGAADPILAFYVDQLQQQALRYQTASKAPGAQLAEPLSEREQEILRALASSMSNKRIAQVLGISPETVKWHLRNVYTKLQVVGRDDAVARARDWGLV
ncbi:LuxR C-terminal-related transcriptional regulator [Comamonas sp. J-3]|uniref:LuxR C-terminal-related transcriptional regulator n=1 Tax=Comamonas trifloxystrobinivorans TaxID=3350256 RepID=UPI00372867F9